jgi:wyosine [tRNA(Phe)-imidazoG37] synthetase (radical SAM superfamily)
MLLPLQQGVLYGPVNSRRYGRSLGINLMPTVDKLCSFNCVYCHYGLTKRRTMNVAQYSSDMPEFDDVVKALEETLQSPQELDLITFSGNGEPTLYPRFAEMVDAVVDLRDRCRPDARVALLSNSTGLRNDDVKESVENIDLPVFKLDAGRAETFRAVNRPAGGIEFDKIVKILSSMDDIYIQTVFVDGKPSNCGQDELTEYIDKLKQIQPKEVHLYSIDRPVPNTEISLVSPDRLERIAAQISTTGGIAATAFYD